MTDSLKIFNLLSLEDLNLEVAAVNEFVDILL